MTLVIAARGTNFIILGADSRGTMIDIAGNRVELNQAVKLIQITKHIGFLVYGDAHISDYLVEKFKEKLSPKKKTVRDIAEEFAEFCREEAEKTKDVPRDYFPAFGYIIAGLDFKNKIPIPQCYRLRSIDAFQLGMYRENPAIAGKYIIARYIFFKEFESNFTVDQLSKLTAKAIYDTGQIDGDVGGEIKMARIDESGFTNYLLEDIESMTSEIPADSTEDDSTDSPEV